jgi:hypothetical protein
LGEIAKNITALLSNVRLSARIIRLGPKPSLEFRARYIATATAMTCKIKEANETATNSNSPIKL